MNIPQNYQEWFHFITVMCQQELTEPYIEKRLKDLNSPNEYMTQQFIQLYGEQQRINTIEWFEQAKSTLKS